MPTKRADAADLVAASLAARHSRTPEEMQALLVRVADGVVDVTQAVRDLRAMMAEETLELRARIHALAHRVDELERAHSETPKERDLSPPSQELPKQPPAETRAAKARARVARQLKEQRDVEPRG